MSENKIVANLSLHPPIKSFYLLKTLRKKKITVMGTAFELN